MRQKIVLINPPGSAVERPSIGLGILKTLLSRAGYNVTVSYDNLRYADFIGLDLYVTLLNTDSQVGLMDWLFSEAAFPDSAPDRRAYIDRLFQSDASLRRILSPQLLLDLRKRSLEFTRETVDRVVECSPGLVGCSSSFCQHTASLALLRLVRNAAPRVVTMMGGANCEGIMGRTTHQLFPWVDFVISGDAEIVIVPLVERIFHGLEPCVYGDDIVGVYSPSERSLSSKPGLRILKESRAVVRDMKAVPIPDYEDYFEQLNEATFRTQVVPGLPIEASRGCWWGEKSHCSFCGLNGGAMTYSSKPAADIIDDMSMLSAKYLIERFEFVDNILDHRYLKTLLPSLASERYKIFVEIKANLSREQVEMLALAGIRWLQPGIESIDSRILALMRKGSQAWQNIVLLKWCRQFGIRVFWNLIYGTPGERDSWYSDQAKIIPLISHFEPGLPVQLQYCRFSPYHERPGDFGIELTAVRWYSHIYPVSSDDLDRLVYFFDKRSETVAGLDSVLSASRSSPELLEFWTAISNWRREWNQDEPPRCQRVSIDNKTWVIDTRSCSHEALIVLGTCASALLDCCESAISESRLMTQMARFKIFTPREIDEAWVFVQSKGFVLTIDDRVISLVHAECIAALPNHDEFPGGYLKE